MEEGPAYIAMDISLGRNFLVAAQVPLLHHDFKLEIFQRDLSGLNPAAGYKSIHLAAQVLEKGGHAL